MSAIMAGASGRISLDVAMDVARVEADMARIRLVVSAASESIVESAQTASEGLQTIGTGAGLTQEHVNSLVLKFGELGTGLLSAAQSSEPFTEAISVMVNKGLEIGVVMSQAGIGIGELASGIGSAVTGFVAANPLLLAATAAAAAFAVGVALVTDEINKTSDVTVTWQDVLLGAFDVVRENLKSRVTAAFTSVGLNVRDTWDFVVRITKKAMNLVIGMQMLVPKMIAATYDKIGPAIGDAFYTGANLAIAALNWLIKASAAPLNLLIEGLNQLTGKNFSKIEFGEIASLENPYEGSMRNLLDAAAKVVVGALKTDFIGEIASTVGDPAEKRAQARKDAKDAEAAAAKAGTAKGTSGASGRPTGTAAAKSVAKAAPAHVPAEAASEPDKSEVERANRVAGLVAETKALQAAVDAMKGEKDALKLSSLERERQAILLEQNEQVKKREDELAKVEIANQTEIAAELRKQIDLIKERGRLKTEKAEAADKAAKEAEALQRTNAELKEMITLLQKLGGLGSIVGKALSFFTGDYGALGGALGALLKMGSGQVKNENGKDISLSIGDVLRDKLGDFGKELTTLLRGAGTGMLAANAILGKQSKNGQIGSSIGGAIGQKLGEKFLSKGFEAIGGKLGSFLGPLAGPLGGILGGVLGGLVGGMFKKTKWARADISGVAGSPGYRSNSGKYEGVVNEAASGVIKGLKDIAQQLGGVAGEFGSIAVGVRDGKWRVNTRGTSLKTSMGAKDFGEDSAAAISYAIQQAVQKGAISGINQSVLNLLQASGDFEAQLSKAVELQNLFSEIAQSANPMGYELEQLAKKFTSINTLLTEANATPEEVARVEAYRQQQEAAIRQRHAEEAAAKRATQLEKEAELLLLQGKATQALAKQREAELIQMDAATQALQKQIHAETDAATRRGLMVQLLEAQGKTMAARAGQRAEELRATEDVNKALQQQIWLTQDLKEAYDRQVESVRATVEEMTSMGDTLKEFRRSIYAADETTLSASQTLVKLITTGSLAATGDKTALGDLSTVGQSYLDAVKASAGSLLEYQRAQALVANYADQAIAYTDTAVSEGEKQLALMKSQAESLISIDENTQSFEDALTKLVAHNQSVTTTSAPVSSLTAAQQEQNARLLTQIEKLESQMTRMVENSAMTRILQQQISSLWKRVIVDDALQTATVSV